MMFFGGWMILVWVITAVVIVWGVIALTRHIGSESRQDFKRTAMDIARERYAKGEITKEEFETIKKNLL